MSENIFPTLQGVNWDFKKTIIWSNLTQTSVSGLEVKTKLWSYPKYEFLISYDFLTNEAYQGFLNSGDIETLTGFYNLVGGSFDDFLYKDPINNKIEIPQVIGTGDGNQTKFQLVRKVGNWIEPILGVDGIPKIFVDGILVTNYTINNYGLVTFTSAPTGVITWTGNYFFRCRFKDDNISFDQLFKYYHTGDFSIVTVKN